MQLTKTATVENGVGDKIEVTIKLHNAPAPNGTYESIFIRLAKHYGLPRVAPYRVRAGEAKVEAK